MAKINCTITLDRDVYDAAKQQLTNLSKWINDQLATFLIDAKPEVRQVFDWEKRRLQIQQQVLQKEKELAKISAELEKKRLTSSVTEVLM